MLVEHQHPTGGRWLCGECQASIAAGWLCDECHNILCAECVGKTHHVPAGNEAGKVCTLVKFELEPAA